MASIQLQLLSGLVERGTTRPIPPCTTRTPFLDAWTEGTKQPVDRPEKLDPSDPPHSNSTLSPRHEMENLAPTPLPVKGDPQAEPRNDSEQDPVEEGEVYPASASMANCSRNCPDPDPTPANLPEEPNGPGAGQKQAQENASPAGELDRPSTGDLKVSPSCTYPEIPAQEIPHPSPHGSCSQATAHQGKADLVRITDPLSGDSPAVQPALETSLPDEGPGGERPSEGRPSTSEHVGSPPVGISLLDRPHKLQEDSSQIAKRDALPSGLPAGLPPHGAALPPSNYSPNSMGLSSRGVSTDPKTKGRLVAHLAAGADPSRPRITRGTAGPTSSVNAGPAEPLFPFSTLLTAEGSELRANSLLNTLGHKLAGPQATASTTGENPFSVSNLSSAGSQPIMEVASSGVSSRGATGTTSPENIFPSWLGEPLDVTDYQRFIHRVSQAFTSGVRRDGTLRLKLHPPELGSLRLEVRFKEGKLNARLVADRPEVYALLTEGLQELRQRLETQQISVEKLEVTLNYQQSESHNQAFPGYPEGPRPTWTLSQSGGLAQEESPLTSPGDSSLGIIETARVDVRI